MNHYAAMTASQVDAGIEGFEWGWAPGSNSLALLQAPTGSQKEAYISTHSLESPKAFFISGGGGRDSLVLDGVFTPTERPSSQFGDAPCLALLFDKQVVVVAGTPFHQLRSCHPTWSRRLLPLLHVPWWHWD